MVAIILPPTMVLTYVAGSAFVVYWLYTFLVVGRRAKNMPPGPPTLPVLGNLHQIPTDSPHFKFTEWSKAYGKIFSLKTGPGTIIVISDRRLVKELLDKRGNIYNSRPDSRVGAIVAGEDNLIVAKYGPRWRLPRRLVHQSLMASICDNAHHRIIEAEGCQMLRDFLLFPKENMMHPKRFSYSISNSIAYGIRSEHCNDSRLARAYELMQNWSLLLEAGSTPPVEIYPWMNYIPQRYFNNWKTRTQQVKGLMESLFGELLEEVQKRRKTGENRGSVIDEVLDHNDKYQLTPGQLLHLGGAMQMGGADTSASVILIALQGIIKNPEVQKKAHKEIDQVIGEDRSPTWEDFGRLPYINMIFKEAQRWRTIGPLGMSHSLVQDDWVDGMLLPKGSTIIVNVWGLHMDPETYENPTAFIPERYSDHPLTGADYANGDHQKRDHYSYGAGRRLCVGINLAERNVFIALAKILWAFDLSHAVDENGEEIPIDTDYATGYNKGFIHGPNKFAYQATVRSEKRRETIMREFEEAEKEMFSRFL